MTALYIHIPFCLHKCAYCDFVSFVSDTKNMERYTELLCREIQVCAERYAHREIGTVYIGGGTPSCLPYGAVALIMKAVHDSFCISDNAEISVECNPGTVDEYKLTEYASCGINRISFGLQSTHNSLLLRIERIHTYEDFLESLNIARKVGFANINADIMYGLPVQSITDFSETLKTVAGLGLSHISAYSLILEEGTPLYERVSKSRVHLPDEDEEYTMHREAVEYLQEAGYRRYEISNYAIPGYECRHNLVYWDVGEYIGVGLNSHSCIFENGLTERHSNTAVMSQYESMIQSGVLPVTKSSIIPTDEQMREYVMLATRKSEGFSLAEFKERFGSDFIDVFGDRLAKINKAYYTITDRFYLTDRGLDMQNCILCDLI